METATHVSTDIQFLNSHSPYFYVKSGLKLFKEKALEMTPKYRRTEAQRWF